jgi:hypothetical protein
MSDSRIEVPRSPLPWQVVSKIFVSDADGRTICVPMNSAGEDEFTNVERFKERRKADAAFIVKAVNNHARLTTEAAALREALRRIVATDEDGEGTTAANIARAALASKGADKP